MSLGVKLNEFVKHSVIDCYDMYSRLVSQGLFGLYYAVSYFTRCAAKCLLTECGKTLYRGELELVGYLLQGVAGVEQSLEQRLAFHLADPSLGCFAKTSFEVTYKCGATHAHLFCHFVNRRVGARHLNDGVLKRQIHPIECRNVKQVG